MVGEHRGVFLLTYWVVESDGGVVASRDSIEQGLVVLVLHLEDHSAVDVSFTTSSYFELAIFTHRFVVALSEL